jgi:hypothetical protein
MTNRLARLLTTTALSAASCGGEVIVKNSSGKKTLGRSAAFAITKNQGKSVRVTLSRNIHSLKIFLYQREPSAAYPLASTKNFNV